MIGRLAEIVLGGKVKKATKYFSPTAVLKATRHGRTNTVVVTMGKPNYQERAFIKKAKAAKEPFPIKKIQMKLFAIPILIGLLTGIGISQPFPLPSDAPSQMIVQSYAKAVALWDFTRLGKPAPLGFRLYCGEFNQQSPDKLWNFYDYMEQVPDPAARSWLLLSLITSLMKDYSPSIHVRCIVVSYNSTGECTDSLKGVPACPVNVRFQVPH